MSHSFRGGFFAAQARETYLQWVRREAAIDITLLLTRVSSLGLGRYRRGYYSHSALLPTDSKLVLRNVLLRSHRDGCIVPRWVLVALGQVRISPLNYRAN
jgi:hypothetical protein